MYRLTVVAGPGRGTSFKLSEGENSIGRQLGNTVVLPSTQVSKRHCVLVASHGELVVRDQGSSNGTFVNGVLSRAKKLQSGDRIGVGEFVLEISGSAPRQANDQNNVVPFPGAALPSLVGAGDAGGLMGTGGDALGAPAVTTEEPLPSGPPKDLKGKALWYFENYAMPIFYGLNLKHEWKVICAVVFAGFLILNLMISVQPLLNANSMSILRETARRASFMARDLAERNSAILAAGAETKTEIGIVDKADGVGLAVLTDLDLRIIAPAQRMNQYMVGGAEARYANRIATQYRAGKEGGHRTVLGDTVVAIEPVKVFDPKKAKNVVIAMAIVAVDASTATLGMGEAGIVYSETLILTGVLGALMLLILYRLTLKPFQILNEDMDKALKGDLGQVTHEFKMEELNPLWDLINSALQRIPRASSGSGELGMGGPDDGKPEQFVAPVKMIADAMRIGVAVCGADRKIAFLNEMFEELSGIRADSAIGQEFSSVGRDQSLGVLVTDLLDRVTVGGDGIAEDYEFSGIACQVYAAAFGTMGDLSARSYVLAVIKKAE